jgi:hypothetical protein
MAPQSAPFAGPNPPDARAIVVVMRDALVIALAAQATACMVDNPLFILGGTATATTTATAATTTATAPTTDVTTTGSQGGTQSGSAGTTAETSTGVTGSTTLDDATTGAVEIPSYPDVASCLELRAKLEELGIEPTSGPYELGSPNGAVVLYCDMSTDDGGWTLVGRSVAGGFDNDFGWRYGRGEVLDDNLPYSLDLILHPIAFTEILIGEYGVGKTWGDSVHVLDAPPDYVNAQDANKADIPYKHKVGAAGCAPQSIKMLETGGFTYLFNTFHFTNNLANCGDDPGLRVDGFLFYDPVFCKIPIDCPTSGDLHGKQGMIMVR